MKNLYQVLKNWIKNSAEKPIIINQEEYKFKLVRDFSEPEIAKFERDYKINLPIQYKEFLLNIGAVELFTDDYSAGIEILSPYEVKNFSKNIFLNYGEDPYPRLFMSVNIPSAGWFGGFDLTQKNEHNFSIFFPEIPPEEWIQEATFTNFNNWLEKVITSSGNELF